MRSRFLLLFLLAFSSTFLEAKDKEWRAFGQIRFGSASFLPQLGVQIPLSKYSSIAVSFAYGNAGHLSASNTWWQNPDGSFSPENDLSWLDEDSVGSSTGIFPGMRESLELDFSTLSMFVQYQLLMVGYIKSKNRWLCYLNAGFSWSEVKQSGNISILDVSGNQISRSDLSTRFHSFAPDIELILSYEHKSGFGLRTGARTTFGFPMNQDFKIVYGTSSGNLFSGHRFDFFGGISYRF